MTKRLTFWDHIERLKPVDGALLTDGVSLWRYLEQRSGCIARLETVPQDGTDPQRVHFSSPAPPIMELV